MPRALRLCSRVGCRALVASGRCRDCTKTHGDGKRAKPRGQAYPGLSYSSARWRKLRAEVLAEEPLCRCDDHRDDTQPYRAKADAPPSTVVDHIQAHKGDPDLFWDRANLRGCAKPCHDAKTSRDDSWNRNTGVNP